MYLKKVNTHTPSSIYTISSSFSLVFHLFLFLVRFRCCKEDLVLFVHDFKSENAILDGGVKFLFYFFVRLLLNIHLFYFICCALFAVSFSRSHFCAAKLSKAFLVLSLFILCFFLIFLKDFNLLTREALYRRDFFNLNAKRF